MSGRGAYDHVRSTAVLGDLDKLKELLEDAPPNHLTAAICGSAEGGHAKNLEYLITKDEIDEFMHDVWSWSSPALISARMGHVSCLEVIFRLKPEIFEKEPNICSNAAQHGHLDCLKYAHENGCKLTSYEGQGRVYGPCTGAAAAGHLNCLKYSHENGCELDWQTAFVAAMGKHEDCLRYVMEHGCENEFYAVIGLSDSKYMDVYKVTDEGREYGDKRIREIQDYTESVGFPLNITGWGVDPLYVTVYI
jgi:hypothetical protein